MKKLMIMMLSGLLLTTSVGCTTLANNTDKASNIKDVEVVEPISCIAADPVDFEVVDYMNLPKDVADQINEINEMSEHQFIETESGLYLVVYMGMRNSGGFSIEIEDVLLVGDEYLVIANESSPGPNSMVTMAITYPYTVVKFNETIDQEKVKVERNSSDQGIDNQNDFEIINPNFTTQIDSYKDGETIVTGEVVQFENNRMHVIAGCIVEAFEGTEELFENVYVGETVELIKDGDSFKIQPIIKEDFSHNSSNFGLLMLNVNGTVSSVKNDIFTLVTEDNKTLTFSGAEYLLVEEGEKLSVEYMDNGDTLSAVEVLRESELSILRVVEIKRSEEGLMIIHASQTEDDEVSHVLTIGNGTTIRLNLSELKAGDDIKVYLEAMLMSYPMQGQPKRIEK